jgi:hypothetical protein
MKLLNKVSRAFRALKHWREVLRDFKLRSEGQRRIAPYGTRGRTHELAGAPVVGGGLNMRARATMVPVLRARHFHADTGEWEDLGTIMKGEPDNGQS